MIKLNEGDTLAIKIENYNKEFDGKSFLFIKLKILAKNMVVLPLKNCLEPK